MTLRIANGAGFWGDWIDAPRRLVEAAKVDFLTLEYLAELTMSILARQRQKDSAYGYAHSFPQIVGDVRLALSELDLRIVTNAGGVNPRECAAKTALELAGRHKLDDLIVAVVTGDEITSRIAELQDLGCEFANLDTGEPLRALNATVVVANAYLGARPIVEALAERARIVITGRVADASLLVGPAAFHFGWDWGDWNRLAGATVAGHLIECGAQVTGGYSTEWKHVPDLANIGYPIAEVEENGSCVITKPSGTGGQVNRRTVVEQLVYEIGDPRAYITPDVVADFTSVRVDDQGEDRVAVSAAQGSEATDSYKVSLAYADGYSVSSTLLIAGDDCIEKARRCANIILDRLSRLGQAPGEHHIEFLGVGAGVPALSAPLCIAVEPREIVLRVSARDQDYMKLGKFTEQFAPLITGGPAGLAGYAVGRSRIQPVYSYWPTLVPKELVKPRVEFRTAEFWSQI